uniref:(northern house mosquito) hypothetical protein n=1 Tax=Culex pipiens TaxID=7175 RepID=A0A8D8JZI3_CULPI
MLANRLQQISSTRALWTAWCVSPRSRASCRSGEETWPTSSDTSPHRPSTLLSRTSTRRSSLMVWTSAPSFGGTSLVTWLQVVLLVPHPSASCIPLTSQEPVLLPMSERLEQKESSVGWVTAW